MQKKDFINLMAETQKITKTKASESLEIVLAGFNELFDREESVKLKGFGELGVRKREPRRFRNPQTGEIEVNQGYLTTYCLLSKSLIRD